MKNRIERYVFARLAILSNERFDETIFIDECSLQARRNASKRWYRYTPGEIRLGFVGRYVHDFNFSIFAGISRQGATELIIFEGKCNAEGFRRIFSQSVLPFVLVTYPNRNWRLQMDNARYHTSPPAIDLFRQHQVYHFRTRYVEITSNCNYSNLKSSLCANVLNNYLNKYYERKNLNFQIY